jgi:hypothetical protein
MDRNFVGIGKIFIDTPTEIWNIPHLHFIVSKCNDETFEAINLEFGLVAIDKTGWDAAQSIASLALTYLFSVIQEGNGFKELQTLARKNSLSDLWGEFWGIEFELAQTGDDLSHHFEKRINRAFKEVIVDKLKETIERKADDLFNEIMELLSMRPPLIEYKEREERQAA